MTATTQYSAVTRALEIQDELAQLDAQRTRLIHTRAVYLLEAVTESGLNPREIGDLFGVGRQRIYQMVEQGGLTMPPLR